MNYINRWRHGQGFGIQSPFAYYLVRFVIHEKLPYYAYSQLAAYRNLAFPSAVPFPVKNYRLLFRLVIYRNPLSMVAVGKNELAFAWAMTLAKPSSPCLLIESPGRDGGEKNMNENKEFVPLFLNNGLNRCSVTRDVTESLAEYLQEGVAPDLMHIGRTENYRQLVETVMPYVNYNTLLVIEDIRKNDERHEWWKSLSADTRCSLSFDLGKTGLLFFDKSYYKQHHRLIY